MRLLDILLSVEVKPEEKKRVLESDFDIPMSKEMQEEANTMCNLGEGLVERTRRETRIETRKETSKEINVNHMLSVMEKLKYTPLEAMDFLEIPMEERPSTLAEVERRLEEVSKLQECFNCAKIDFGE